jgi:hypothetical protein
VVSSAGSDAELLTKELLPIIDQVPFDPLESYFASASVFPSFSLSFCYFSEHTLH